jgi:hypothetical protein
MLVFIGERHAGHQPVVRGERDADPRIVVAAERVRLVAAHGTGLHVRSQTHFEGHAGVTNVIEQVGVVTQSRPMPDPARMSLLEGLADRLGAERFTGVNGDRQPVGMRERERFGVCPDGVSSFRPREVEPAHAVLPVVHGELGQRHGGGGRQVTQRAYDDRTPGSVRRVGPSEPRERGFEHLVRA